MNVQANCAMDIHNAIMLGYGCIFKTVECKCKTQKYMKMYLTVT